MTLGVLSDTHNRITPAAVALQAFVDAGAQLVFHCGDWTNFDTAHAIADIAENLQISLFGVLGDSDGELRAYLKRHPSPFQNMHVTLESTFEIQLEQLGVCVYHGHDEHVLESLAESGDYDVLFTGHTHLPTQKMCNKTLLVNPGSSAFSLPQRSSKQATAVLFDTETLNVRTIPLLSAQSVAKSSGETLASEQLRRM